MNKESVRDRAREIAFATRDDYDAMEAIVKLVSDAVAAERERCELIAYRKIDNFFNRGDVTAAIRAHTDEGKKP